MSIVNTRLPPPPRVEDPQMRQWLQVLYGLLTEPDALLVAQVKDAGATDDITGLSALVAAHIADADAVHGTTGSLVDETTAQTLTNKTLDAPTIDDAAINDAALTNPTLTGNVRLGPHSANADAPITGYVTVLDSTGTSRKLAVIA